MSKYLGPINRISRRLGFSLRGDNSEFKKRTTTPGIHGREIGTKKTSPYSKMLTERQKLRFWFMIREKQLRNMINKLEKSRNINLSEKLIFQLSSRLDNVIWESGVKTRRCARQLVSHNHFLLNGKPVKTASIIVKEGDAIQMKEESKLKKSFFEKVWDQSKNTPSWISFDKENNIIKIVGSPVISPLIKIDFPLVIQSYKKKM